MRVIGESPGTVEPTPSLLQFLEWVSAGERTYDDTMAAWRTSCPRLSAWEDASIGGCVELVHDAEGSDVVRLTELGRTLLNVNGEAGS